MNIRPIVEVPSLPVYQALNRAVLSERHYLTSGFSFTEEREDYAAFKLEAIISIHPTNQFFSNEPSRKGGRK
jgi:hypothetical protein